MKAIENYKCEPGKCLILRTCSADGTSYGGFRWPLEPGVAVEAPDWNPEPVCGGGLHGLLWGIGDSSLMDLRDDSVGIVFESDVNGVVSLGTKVKVKSAVVLCVGTLDEAANWLNAHQTNTEYVGYKGIRKGGHYSTLTGGYGSTLTGGDYSTLKGGDGSTLTGGYGSTLTGGYGSTLIILYWNGKRWKYKAAQVKDEDGDGQLEPNTAYRLDGDGNFVVAKDGRAD